MSDKDHPAGGTRRTAIGDYRRLVALILLTVLGWVGIG